MANYSVATAERDLASLVERATAGEEVIITDDRGHVVEMKARETTAKLEPEVGTMEWLTKVRNEGPFISISSVELLRQMYEDD